jgi:hypothetical protein
MPPGDDVEFSIAATVQHEAASEPVLAINEIA